MGEIVFNITQEQDGGYVAVASGKSIFTQGDTLEELHANVSAAVEAFFFDSAKPESVRLYLVRDELLNIA